MSTNPLNIVSTSTERSDYIPSRQSDRKQLQAKFERLWLIDPEQFNPLRNCLQKERLNRTFALLTQHVDLKNKKIVDIGCGSGVFTRILRDAGGNIEAIDIAYNALKRFSDFDPTRIETFQDVMPETKLSDEKYEVVVCLELIAELPPKEYRLFFAELARIIKADGYLICSSSIDIQSEDGMERLINFAQTEFEIIDTKKSYNALFIRLKNVLQTPRFYVDVWKDPVIRKKEMSSRKGLSRRLLYLNSSTFLIWIWFILATLMQPLLNLMKNNRSLLMSLEKICQFISDEEGVSHLIFIAKRKAMQKETDIEDKPMERPKKKEVWE